MSKQILIGLSGPAGCGKDTVARYLSNCGYHRYTLAMPLKMGLEVMLGISLDVWDDRVRKEQVIDWLGKSPRQVAQTLGTEWGRQQVHPELWVKLMLRKWDEVRRSGSPRMVVTDVRFDNEAQAIKDAGGTVWRIDREKVASVAEHVSEKGVNPALIEGSFKNSGTLDQLEARTIQWSSFLMKRYAK